MYYNRPYGCPQMGPQISENQIGFRGMTQIKENQMENEVDNESEAGLHAVGRSQPFHEVCYWDMFSGPQRSMLEADTPLMGSTTTILNPKP